MDIASIATQVFSGLLGIATIGAFVGKYAAKAKKYAAIAKEAITLVDDAVEGLEDGKLSDAEIAKIAADVEALKARL